MDRMCQPVVFHICKTGEQKCFFMINCRYKRNNNNIRNIHQSLTSLHTKFKADLPQCSLANDS